MVSPNLHETHLLEVGGGPDANFIRLLVKQLVQPLVES